MKQWQCRYGLGVRLSIKTNRGRTSKIKHDEVEVDWLLLIEFSNI